MLYSMLYLTPYNWINVRDPLYFLGYGIPYIYVKRILFLAGAMWAKIISHSSSSCRLSVYSPILNPNPTPTSRSLSHEDEFPLTKVTQTELAMILQNPIEKLGPHTIHPTKHLPEAKERSVARPTRYGAARTSMFLLGWCCV